MVVGDNRGEQLHAAAVRLGHELPAGQAIGQVGDDGHRLTGFGTDLVEAGSPGIQHGFAQGRYRPVRLTGELGHVLHFGGERVVEVGDDPAQHVQTIGDLAVLQVEQMVVDPVEHLDGIGVDVGTCQTQIGV